ncbi:MAG: Mandelate racemase/muconate lactonizing protein [Myxococcales bacterium]|nr:Mandelate racemase/muconate lactonizing protein [Myxococcales bacterium]
MEIVRVRSRLVRWPITGEGSARGRDDRAAILVEVRTATGAIGLGEAAPLPGTSSDSLDDAAAAIDALTARVPFTIKTPARPAHEDATAARELIAAITSVTRSVTTAPAARFAIETALLTAVAEEIRRPLGDLLAAAFASEIDAAVAREHDAAASPGSARENRRRSARGTVLQSAWGGAVSAARSSTTIAPPSPALSCAVVIDDVEQAVRAIAAGAQVLKIKVGPTGDLDRVIEIHRAAPEALLRLDANRTWQRALTRPLLHALADLPIDFVEEPCHDAHELLVDPLPCPIALDESLALLPDAAIEAALATPGLAALVLKPTLLGGLAACLALAARARAAGKDAVITHALEGPIGTAACAELALALGGSCSAGLAPHPALIGWSPTVAQLGASTIRRVAAPGLALGCDLDQVIAP